MDTKVQNLSENPRNAVAGGHKAKLHKLSKSVDDNALIAFPNDRAQSIRPEHDKYK